MKTLNEKIIELLRDKRDCFLGAEGEVARDNFKQGLSWAIDTIELETKTAEFEEVARQLMQHMANPRIYHPHHSVIVTSTNAELLEGKQSTGNIMDYIKD